MVATYRLVREGGPIDFPSLQDPALEQQFQEGDYQELQIDLRIGLAADFVMWIQQQLEANGVVLWDDVRQEGSTLIIRTRYMIWPLTVLAGILVGAIGFLVLVVTWRLYEVIPDAAGWKDFFLRPEVQIALVLVGAGLVMALLPRSGGPPRGAY